MNSYSGYFLVAALLAASGAQAQSVLWASKVVGISSQKATGKEPFAAEQVLGEPNALPLGEISNNAWTPGKDGSNEFVEVRFAHAMKAHQVTVIENANPGAKWAR